MVLRSTECRVKNILHILLFVIIGVINVLLEQQINNAILKSRNKNNWLVLSNYDNNNGKYYIISIVECH